MKNKIKMSLKNKVLLNVVITIVVFLVILIFSLNKLAINAITSTQKENILSILDGQSDKVEIALSRPLQQVQAIAQEESVGEYTNGKNKQAAADKVMVLFRSIMIGSKYSNIYLMDTTGNVILSADPSFLNNNFSFRDYFTRALEGGSHIQIAFGVLTQKPGYYFSAPVYLGSDVVGVVVIKVEVGYIESLFEESLINSVGHHFLTDENGVIVTTSKDIERYQSMGKISEKKIAKITKERRFDGFGVKPLQYQLVQDVIEDYRGQVAMEYLDYSYDEGGEYERELLSVQKIGDYPFYLVTESNLDTIFEQIYKTIWPISLLLITSFAIGISILSFQFKKVFEPLNQLASFTKDISEGVNIEPINIRTGDEIESLSLRLGMMVNTLKDAKAKLEEKVEIKTGLLKANMTALEAKNQQMSKNEMAMLNILEDSKELEKQLAEEKLNVEQKVVDRTRELSNEQARLMASISALPRAFIILDNDSNILTQNGKLDDIFGKQAEEWSIELIDQLIGESLDLQDKLKTVYAKKENFDISDILYKEKYIRVFVAPVINNDGELLGAVMTIKDESEAKALARSRDEFFSIASHELRTPLTAIRGNTSMIIEYYKDALKDKELKEMIEDTHAAAIRLIGIVNDFLDLSRLEQGRMEYKKERIDVIKIVDKVLKDLTESANEKGIPLIMEGESKLELVLDPEKFEQIMLNLLGNSLKFTSQGSISVKITKEEDKVRIEVKDTGEGIAVKNRNLLFRKFQQAGQSTITRDGSKGTGLGLYISRLMAEGMGGTLELVSSEIGKGSVFGITLPIKDIHDSR